MTWLRDIHDPTTSWPGEQPAPFGFCPECAGAGKVLEQLDDDRLPVSVPCGRCQIFCRACARYVQKPHHCPKEHPMQSDLIRIADIESLASKRHMEQDEGTFDGEPIALAICEVARQLSRIADAYEEVHK